MASVPTYQSNPYADFDPSQWSNPYSLFQSQALPWPSQYSGWPTDAMGRPIQPQPGMTLNSQPQQTAAPAAPAAASGATYYAGRPGTPNFLTSQTWNPQQFAAGAPGVSNAQSLANRQTLQNQMQGLPTGAGSGAAAAAPAATSNPSGLNAQQYLQLLANPGQVTTPGATVPQASSAQPGPGVLQQFMQNWRPQASGPGSGFTNNFYQALKAQGY